MSRKRTCAISSSISFLLSAPIQEERKHARTFIIYSRRRCREKVQNCPKKSLQEARSLNPSACSGQAKPFDSLTLAQDRVEWLRFFSFTKSPAISASFLARDHFLIWISRFRAEPSVAWGSKYTRWSLG